MAVYLGSQKISHEGGQKNLMVNAIGKTINKDIYTIYFPGFSVRVVNQTLTDYSPISSLDESLPVTDMPNTFSGCSNLVNAPVIPNSVTNMAWTFYRCSKLIGNIYIYSYNISSASGCFQTSDYPKNVYVPENSLTYNTFNAIYGSGANGVTLLTFSPGAPEQT